MLDRPLVSRGITVELVGSDRRVDPNDILEFSDLRAARAFLAPIAADADQLPELRRIAAELAPGVPLRELDELVARVADALVERRVVLRRLETTFLAADVYTPPEPQDDGGDGDEGPVELDWIEARLLDEDGVGIANQKCVVVAPDGERHNAYTDSLGTTRLSAIPRGGCKVLYPELDLAALPKSADQNPTKAEMRERFTAHELIVGLPRSTGEAHQFRLLNLTLKVRLAIDPNDTASRDDQFILHAVKGGADQKIIKTIKDDQVPGDASVDLVYEHLWRDHRYTLEVDPGAEGDPYAIFKDLPLQQLVSH